MLLASSSLSGAMPASAAALDGAVVVAVLDGSSAVDTPAPLAQVNWRATVSRNGDDWANMPNAVHDYRIDIRSDTAEPMQAQGKNDEFTAKLQCGDGATSESCALAEGD